jgi:hypothetical protein
MLRQSLAMVESNLLIPLEVQQAIEDLDRRQLSEIRSLRQPPPSVRIALQVLHARPPARPPHLGNPRDLRHRRSCGCSSRYLACQSPR